MSGTLLVVMVNLVIIVFFAFPLVIFLSLFRRKSLSQPRKLRYGLVVIAWGAFMFAFLTDGADRMKEASAESQDEIQVKSRVVNSFGTWLFILPAVALAIGANFVTAYLLSDGQEPHNKTQQGK